MLDFVDGCT